MPNPMPLPKGLEKQQDQKWHFRFIHREGKYHMREMIEYNYKIVNITDFPQIKGDPRLQPDGTIVHGDLVLAACDAQAYKDRMEAHNQETSRRLRAVKQSYHAQTRGEGTPTFEQDRPGTPAA